MWFRRPQNPSQNSVEAEEAPAEEDLVHHTLGIHFYAPRNYVPGWHPLLDIWVAMDGVCRNQVRLTQEQMTIYNVVERVIKNQRRAVIMFNVGLSLVAGVVAGVIVLIYRLSGGP